jgi:hypothetical protein
MDKPIVKQYQFDKVQTKDGQTKYLIDGSEVAPDAWQRLKDKTNQLTNQLMDDSMADMDAESDAVFGDMGDMKAKAQGVLRKAMSK